MVRVMVFNVTFNNISVISWRSVLLMEEDGVPRRERLTSQVTWPIVFLYWPVTSHWQIVFLYGVIRLTCHKSLTNSMFIWSNTIDLSHVTDKNDWPVTSHWQIVFLYGVIRLTCHKSLTNSIFIWSNTIDLSQDTDK